jgi:3-dehydroquinate synthase
MILNFGHTLGHAYELAGGYETYTHGQAVAAGMVRAAELGIGLGITPPHLADTIRQLTAAFGLPQSIPCAAEDYAAAIGLDKKGEGEKLSLVLLDRPGHAILYKIKKSELLQLV